VEVSVVYNLLSVPQLLIGFAQDLFLVSLYFAVLEDEVMGESRVPDVAEARRVSIFEEADVGELGDIVFVDSKSVGTS